MTPSKAILLFLEAEIGRSLVCRGFVLFLFGSFLGEQKELRRKQGARQDQPRAAELAGAGALADHARGLGLRQVHWSGGRGEWRGLGEGLKQHCCALGKI